MSVFSCFYVDFHYLAIITRQCLLNVKHSYEVAVRTLSTHLGWISTSCWSMTVAICAHLPRSVLVRSGNDDGQGQGSHSRSFTSTLAKYLHEPLFVHRGIVMVWTRFSNGEIATLQHTMAFKTIICF